MKLESELKHNGVHEANIRSSRTVRGQMLEAEAEDKILASRTAWPRGLNITGYLHWTLLCHYICCVLIHIVTCTLNPANRLQYQ